ncbi:MAG: polyphosphate kinase 1 [bacterium]|nr:polyphosphate kinase 1 [bacterium]
MRNYTQNRELSWLKFNERVLEEATDKTVPLLERLKFISIFTSNLDEFFMVRVGSLYDMKEVDPTCEDKRSGMTPGQQLMQIYKSVTQLNELRESVFTGVEKQLRLRGVSGLLYSELEKEEKDYVMEYYKAAIEPVLSPQIVDTHHPFPHLDNKSLYIGSLLKKKKGYLFGIIPVPKVLPEILVLPGSELRYILTENIIYQFVTSIFSMFEVVESTKLCVTRNADINLEDENYADEIDFRNKMKLLLKKRKRLSVVRLEVSEYISKELEGYFCNRFGIEPYQIMVCKAPMNMSYVFSLESKLDQMKKRNLLYKPFKPVKPLIDNNTSIIRSISKKDVMLSYPYDSMDLFLKLLKEASVDERVISIKITLYRVASKAKLVEYLCEAAENGKDVIVLIELRARFDEQNNIDWSEQLEEAGCKVMYGFEGYKVHSKICLITYKESNTIKYITQVGTGNYNEKTAKMYTDVCLMTGRKEIGQDANEFFKNMSIGNLYGEYKHLLVAPVSLKSKVLELIGEEMKKGEQGLIQLKINSITDIDIIDKLKEASSAGVKINMIVRGICCIVPGVKNETENITVTSIVGRYLEHARIYDFGKGEEEKLFIASADFMTRNTENRVEVACPIYDEETKEKIKKILEVQTYDNVKARELFPDGNYRKKENHGTLVNAQEILSEEAEQQAQGVLELNLKKESFLYVLRNRFARRRGMTSR